MPGVLGGSVGLDMVSIPWYRPRVAHGDWWDFDRIQIQIETHEKHGYVPGTREWIAGSHAGHAGHGADGPSEAESGCQDSSL